MSSDVKKHLERKRKPSFLEDAFAKLETWICQFRFFVIETLTNEKLCDQSVRNQSNQKNHDI